MERFYLVDTKENNVHVVDACTHVVPFFQVLTHITRCYTVAAQFEESREKITEMPVIIKDLCRVLYHKVRTFEMIAVSITYLLFLEWILQNQISA